MFMNIILDGTIGFITKPDITLFVTDVNRIDTGVSEDVSNRWPKSIKTNNPDHYPRMDTLEIVANVFELKRSC